VCALALNLGLYKSSGERPGRRVTRLSAAGNCAGRTRIGRGGPAAGGPLRREIDSAELPSGPSAQLGRKQVLRPGPSAGSGSGRRAGMDRIGCRLVRRAPPAPTDTGEVRGRGKAQFPQGLRKTHKPRLARIGDPAAYRASGCGDGTCEAACAHRFPWAGLRSAVWWLTEKKKVLATSGPDRPVHCRAHGAGTEFRRHSAPHRQETPAGQGFRFRLGA